MNQAAVFALMQQATNTYPTMMTALLSAMRTHQRNDEPARDGTTPAAAPLAMACVLAVRMAHNPDALDLAAALFVNALELQRGEAGPGDGAEECSRVLRLLEDGGVI